MEQVIRQMAEAFKGLSVNALQDVAGYGFQLVNDIKKQEGITPEQEAEIDKSVENLQTKLTEFKNVRNSYQ